MFIGAQQINQQINVRKAESSKAYLHCIFSVMLPLPRQPVQQPKTQSADCARFDIKHYAYIHYGLNTIQFKLPAKAMLLRKEILKGIIRDPKDLLQNWMETVKSDFRTSQSNDSFKWSKHCIICLQISSWHFKYRDLL